MTYKMQIAGYLAVITVILGGAFPAFASRNDREASCWISAHPERVYEGGSTTLTWGSNNADDAWISDIGHVAVSGSRTIYDVDKDTVFRMTVENERGTAECETRIDVRASWTGHSNKAPGCTLYRENWGSGVILRWTTTDATSAELSGFGSVGLNGSQFVNPAHDTRYVLTVHNNDKSNRCEIRIDRPYGVYTQPTYGQYTYSYQYQNAPYVYLSQIPYTGFDLGVVGTAVYFLALALFAAAGAYLVAYYQGGVLRFAFAQEVHAAARNQIRAIRSIIG